MMEAATGQLSGMGVAAEPLRCLLRGLRPGVVARALVTALLCSACFPVLILVLAWHSMGLKELGWVAGMPIVLGLASTYALFGLHFGFVIPLLRSLLEQVADFEKSLAPIAEPVVRRVFAWMPAEASMELPEFQRKVDETVAACFGTEGDGMMGLPLRVAYRFVFRKSIEAFRDALVHDLVQELRARGETKVTAELLRTHASRHVAAMAAEKLQTRLEYWRTVHLDITLLIFAIPLGVAIYRLA